MLRLTLNFEILTPLFLGDADQRQACLRPPAFKGMLRFWYRAADPEFRKYEDAFFGGAGAGKGQSSVLLSLDASRLRRVRWADFNDRRFSTGQGRDTKNGLIYLGFPLRMRGGDERAAVAPGHSFTLSCLIARPRPEQELERLRRATVAAAWLLGHFGGIGTRARRGFGCLSLRGWDVQGEWPEVQELPLVTDAESWSAARGDLDSGLRTIRAWFGDGWPAQTPHPHLGKRFDHKVVNREHRDWAKALAEMGESMQRFRSRRAPDYQNVKDHITGRRPLSTTPQRATFGLPIAFRYSSLNGRSAMILPFQGPGLEPHGRHGSLLFLRLLKIGDALYPHYVRMDGAVPGMQPRAVVRGEGRPLSASERNLADVFFQSIDVGGR